MSIFTNKSKNSTALTNKAKNLSALCDSYSESNLSILEGLFNGGNIKLGQSFTGDGKVLDSGKFYLRKIGSPTGNATMTIYAHTGTFGTNGLPTGTVLATSNNFDVSTLTTSFQLIDFNFTGTERITLTNGTHYFVIIEYSGGDGSNLIGVGADISSPTHSGNAAFYTSSWGLGGGDDLCFYVYTKTVLTNKSKNSTSLTNKAKVSTSLTNKAKVSTSFTNRSK